MKELIRSNDPVLLSYIDALLSDAGIPHDIADMHMSIMDGSIGILPRRMLVRDEDFEAARRVVASADIELPDPDDGWP
ncbi:MAG: DUF2007 domain-containing protein [Rhodomicrobium sp.]|nr:DUF2007 domain-containing protein [Rhodomicrobium sp.]